MRAGALALLLLGRAAGAAELCPGVLVEDGTLELTPAEKRLVCGDPESEGWKTIPRAQAEGFLRAFLQTRARHAPTFEKRGAALVLRPGPVTKVTALGGRDLPPGVDMGKRRRIVGRPLTPATLDAVAAWSAQEMQDRGWACAEADASADPATGEILAKGRAGKPLVVGPVDEPVLKGLDARVFRRYEAFARGYPYDRRLFALTSERIIAETLFLSSHYEVDCASSGTRIIHRVVSGPPRLVRIGVGVDTEGFARLRARWTHSLIGARASTLQATFQGSTREQSLEGFMRLYPAPASRAHLVPRASLERRDEPRFETHTLDVSLSPSVSVDGPLARWEWGAGPVFQYSRTVRGLGAGDTDFLGFRGRVSLLSHLFELYVREPRTGYRADLEVFSRAADVHSDLTAHRVSLDGEALWNLGSYDPPWGVLGSRGRVGATLTGAEEAALADLPPAFRFFPGGDADYRGVGRGVLAGDAGFFTTVYHGAELRAGDVLPLRLQPLVFLDAAMGGRRSLRLEPDVYWAPGFGARWPTFVGSFRVTLARNLVWHRDPATVPPRPHWQFFFSYGREF
jgi:outer membrane translocation and assembly module TamA